MTNRIRGTCLGLAVALAFVPVVAEAQEAERSERFGLFTGCSSVVPLLDLDIDGASPGSVDGLTRSGLSEISNNRLRIARLNAPVGTDPFQEGYPILMTSIRVVGSTASVTLELLKPLHDPSSGEWGFGVTWTTKSQGMLVSVAFTVGVFSRALDHFLDEYLSVNEAACP